MNLFKKWEENWLNRREEELSLKFESDLTQLKDSFKETLDEWTLKIESLDSELSEKYQRLKHKQIDVEELSIRVDLKKIELENENQKLKEHIKRVEEKTTLSSVWVEAFSSGFSKAWDMMGLMNSGFDKVKKEIEDKAIQDTLRRMNGHNKKNY